MAAISRLPPRPALKLADYAVTEAGFGADLKAEKFFDNKCRAAGMDPSAGRHRGHGPALKNNGGVPKTELGTENLEALEKGLPNLLKHVENITKVFRSALCGGHQPLYAGHRRRAELIRSKCAELGVNVAVSEVWGKGGDGGIELAEEVLRLCEQPHTFRFAYDESVHQGQESNASAGSMAVRASSTPDGGKNPSPRWSRWAMEACPSAWQKPSILCLTTPKSSAVPRISPSQWAR